MATGKNKPSKRITHPQPAETRIGGNGTPTKEQLAEMGRRAMALLAAHDEREARQAEVDRRIRRKACNGVTLRGERLERAEHLLSDINMGAVSAHQLAGDAINDPERAEGYLIAVEIIAQTICRRVDVLSALLSPTGQMNFGNFQGEFEVGSDSGAVR